jgi:hypothetical protein
MTSRIATGEHRYATDSFVVINVDLEDATPEASASRPFGPPT